MFFPLKKQIENPKLINNTKESIFPALMLEAVEYGGRRKEKKHVFFLRFIQETPRTFDEKISGENEKYDRRVERCRSCVD